MIPRESLSVPSPALWEKGNGVSLEGTVGASVKSDAFKFESSADSNVVVRVKGEGNVRPRIEIGVYYV